uniref:Xylose isomerase-like TIM barrel domain-containing protein n=1 Tax=Plectus sambesii TaxID=2011161 RepID=A0A914W129_9BILA
MPSRTTRSRTKQNVTPEVSSSPTIVSLVPKLEVNDDVVDTVVEEDIKQVPKKQQRKKKAPSAEETDVKPLVVSKKPKKEAKDIKEEMLQQSAVAAQVLKAAGSSLKWLGVHVSAAGGIEQAVYNARQMGCRSFALFLKNQRQWASKPLEDSAVEKFKNALQECDFPVERIVPHSSYLFNLGSPDKDILEKTRNAMLDEVQRCERLGIKLYNFHSGSTTNKCTVEECLTTVAETINLTLKKTQGVTLLIETMSRQGNTVGGHFEELRSIIDQVEDKSRIGVCLDTCHIFAAGYDIRNETVYEETMSKFERIVGFQYLKAVHLNDSKGALGSHLDRHENIGKGLIAKAGFSLLMNDPRFDRLPMILETPEGSYTDEMILLHSLEDRK